MSPHKKLPTPWKKLHSEYIIKTPWLRLRRDHCELPNHSVIKDYYIAERPDVVGIVAMTPQNTLLTNLQYRHGIAQIAREIPAGLIDEHEEPLSAAQRELKEESGYTSQSWYKLKTMVAWPAAQNNFFHVFLALDIQQTGNKIEQDAREEIVNELVPFATIREQMKSGEISSSWSLLALYLAFEYLEQHKKIA